MLRQTTLLQFNDVLYPHLQQDKHVRDGLSAVAQTGEFLWLTCDESISIERLRSRDGGKTYGEHVSFLIGDFIDLPAGDDHEIDIEGMEYQHPYLWIVGSHGLKRKKPKEDPDDPDKDIARLAKVVKEENRYLLARIPLLRNEQTGEFELHRECPDPDHLGRWLRAGRLKSKNGSNELMAAIKDDEHLRDFLKIPGKDNGFDIEGLAVYHKKIFLGLRGPVLRGWAVMLEIELESESGEWLELKATGQANSLYKKYFLKLGGLGIRGLSFEGTDMLILAGPTMELDGTIAVFRWKDAAIFDEKDNMVPAGQVERLFDVPHGYGEKPGKDKAEGLAVLADGGLLVVYDSPADGRKLGADGVMADIFDL